MGRDTPTAAQIEAPESPRAEERTILARSTTRCGVFRFFTNCCKRLRSPRRIRILRTGRDGRGEERPSELEAENRRLKEVIAADQIGESGAKKNAWRLDDYATLPRELWPVIVAEVERTRTQSDWSVDRTLAALGIARATYYRQRGEQGHRETEAPKPVSVHAVTTEERAAVIAFKRRHPELRHRALAWTMVDEDVAYVSPSTV